MTYPVNRNVVLQIARAFVGVGPSTASGWYDQITEGRRSRPGFYYGWCGDFVTYVLMRAGVRRGDILNRAQLNNGTWTPGDNLNRLLRWAKANGALANWVRPGDIFISYRPDGNHIGFVEWTPAKAKTWVTLNGNGVGGVVSRNFGFKNKIVAIINVEAIPTGGVGMPYESTKPKPVSEGGDTKEF